MRYLHERQSAKDKELTIPIFAISPEEIKVLVALMARAQAFMPLLYQNDIHRMHDMVEKFRKYMKEVKGINIDHLNDGLGLYPDAVNGDYMVRYNKRKRRKVSEERKALIKKYKDEHAEAVSDNS